MDSISNFLTIIRNGFMVGKRTVNMPFSRITHEVAQVLKNEGFINDVRVSQADSHKQLEVDLRYIGGESVIHSIERESTPGRRHYAKAKNIKPIIGKLGISILTTSKGIMTDKQARQMSVGGEIICSVW